nr:hypothetical protein [Tanacetum cinerariifolium]
MSGYDQKKINVLQIFHVTVNKCHVDYVILIWMDFIFKSCNPSKLLFSIPDSPNSLLMISGRSAGVSMIQPKVVESTQGTIKTPSATRTPNPKTAKKNKKGKQSVGESITPKKFDAFRKRDHDDHPDDDALLKREKVSKRKKTSRGSKSARGSLSKQPAKGSNTTSSEQPQQQNYDAWVNILEINEDEVILKDETPKLLNEFQNVNKRVPKIFDHKRMEATLKDMMSNQFRNAEEYAYHLEQAQNYMENQIILETDRRI